MNVLRRVFILLTLGLVMTVGDAEESEAFLTFDNTKFLLRYSPSDSPIGLHEYLPAGQTVENWTQMLSSRRFEGLNDPKAYAEAIAKQVADSGPYAKSQIFQNDKEGFFIVDFLMFSMKGQQAEFAEWNLMRIQKDGDNALWVCQYARRIFKLDEKMAALINADRERLLPPFGELQFPK